MLQRLWFVTLPPHVMKRVSAHLLIGCVVAALAPVVTMAQQSPSASETKAHPAPARRDGQHDFDFNIGRWKTHLTRLTKPLSGSTAWVEYEGITVVRKVWDGRANLAELEADGPAGHLQVLSLRLYDPAAHQWSLNSASSRSGALSTPTIGEFRDGRGEFFDQEVFNGRTILVRNIWSNITADSCRFEQSFSDDGGKTWEVNWIAVDTRIKDE
jgi:hypothetical protein